MVELQSCATLVNASALCAVEQEVRGERVHGVADILDELQREKHRNAELMERISILEAQIKERDNNSLVLSNGHVSCPCERERNYNKFKKRKTDSSAKESQKIEDGNITASDIEHDTRCTKPREVNLEKSLVSWLSTEDTEFLHYDKPTDSDYCYNTDDSNEEEDELFAENDKGIDHKARGNAKAAIELKEHLLEEVMDKRNNFRCLGNPSDGHVESTYPHGGQELNEDLEDSLAPDVNPLNNNMELIELDRKKSKMIGVLKESGSPTKVAFCPKEVKRILQSEVLQLKHAQSHTIRKIIVFASLGIRHGCQDMYELDFNHFSIMRKGEPYMSPENPGEYVLYESPGNQRKVFYPNRRNPMFCPVQILEEEKSMRPSDASCPSCLFLCIKYGGATRNLPQNEYVRQQMGKNKLKSFGPVMCQMGRLIHIRSGSFFFKALGITLLFMVGFPGDLVQKETKYRNLALLQKYYRTDKSAEGEELFLSGAVACDTTRTKIQHQTGEKIPAKSRGKKHENPETMPLNSQRTPTPQSSTPSTCAPRTKFGLIKYGSIQTHSAAAFQSIPSSQQVDRPLKETYQKEKSEQKGKKVSRQPLKEIYKAEDPEASQTLFNSPTFTDPSFTMFSPSLANAFVPLLYYCHPPNAFPHSPYPSSYGYQSFPYFGNYMSINPRSYFTHPLCDPVLAHREQGMEKNGAASEEADSDSECSSSSTAEPKVEITSSKS